MNRIDQLFARLDRWRHLPAYQLERRADIFFSMYLAEVLEAVTGVTVDPRFIPEFPIKRELIWPKKPSKKSVKVDYAVFAADRSKLFLVELKTDFGSRRGKQDEYLRRAQEIGLAAILGGIVDIVQATTAHEKYAHLLQALVDHDVLALPDNLMDLTFPDGRRDLQALDRRQGEIKVTVAAQEFEVEVVYVQPESKADGAARMIDFEMFAQVVEGHDDEISQAFARHLRRWVEKAGVKRPDRISSAIQRVSQGH